METTINIKEINKSWLNYSRIFFGFYSKLRQYNINQVKEETSGYEYQEGFEAGIRMLAKTQPPSAIFCTSDLIAVGVMDAARYELGLRIPEDVSIVGCDDIEMASWETYNLTTVRQPVNEMIEEVVRIVDTVLREEEGSCKVKVISPKLIERSSVAMKK